MTSPFPTQTLQGLSACLEALAAVDPAGLGGGEQAELLQQVRRAEARLAAVRLGLLAAADRARTARACGAADTGQWAAALGRLDPAEAHRQVGLATSLAGTPATRAALAEGEISTEHAEVITRADRQLPDHVTTVQRASVEQALVEQAKTLSPKALRRAARRALAAVEPDPAVVDAEEDRQIADEETAARARTRLSRHDNGDGTATGRFTLPTLHAEILRKVLEAITAPRRGRLGASAAQVGPATEQAAGPTLGPRTDWDHARGLAFCEILEHLPTDHLHPCTAATVVVTLDEQQLRAGLKAAGLDTGEVISSGEARRLACGAGLIPAVLGGPSLPLDLGHTRRLFTDAQRVALGLTHATCAADGCQRPYAWCELHHRQPWSQGGRTDLTDALPLCHFHHTRIHDPGYHHRTLPDGTIRFHTRT